MTRNEYQTRINEFGDKAWQQEPTLPPLPTENEQQPIPEIPEGWELDPVWGAINGGLRPCEEGEA